MNKYEITRAQYEMKARPINYTVDELEAWVSSQVDQDSEIIAVYDSLEEARSRFEIEREECSTRRVSTCYGFSVIDFDLIQIVEIECDEDGEDTYSLYDVWDSYIEDSDDLREYDSEDEDDE